MRNFSFLLIFQTIIMISGCSKENCTDKYQLDRIELINYNLQNVENIIITGYLQGSNFNIVIDSFEIISYQNLDSVGLDNYIFLDKTINTEYDYDIYCIDMGTHSKITGIKIKKDLCYDGIFKKDYSYYFDEYYVNGTLFKCQVLKAFSLIL